MECPPPPPDEHWWRSFFESPESLRLAFFPDPSVTDQQVKALDRQLKAWRPGRVLDLCCGHGRHLVPLLQRGHPVIGLDASCLMTTRAHAAARQAGCGGRVVRAEAHRMPFRDAAFDVVLCLFNSFGYLATDEEHEAVLLHTARCLMQNGRFLLDTRNRAYQLSQLPFSEIVPLQGGGAVWLECKHDPERDRLVSEFRAAGSGQVLHRASIRSYSFPQLEQMLDRCGFTIEETFGGYDWRPFRGASRELIILARRRGGKGVL